MSTWLRIIRAGILSTIVVAALAAPVALLAGSGNVSAAPTPCRVGEVPSEDNCVPVDACDPAAPGCETEAESGRCDRNCVLTKYLNPIINFLAISVGLVVTISIVVGGIQYASSADDPQKVAKAKSRIFNALLGLVAFLFIYAFLQWVMPGGFL